MANPYDLYFTDIRLFQYIFSNLLNWNNINSVMQVKTTIEDGIESKKVLHKGHVLGGYDGLTKERYYNVEKYAILVDRALDSENQLNYTVDSDEVKEALESNIIERRLSQFMVSFVALAFLLFIAAILFLIF